MKKERTNRDSERKKKERNGRAESRNTITRLRNLCACTKNRASVETDEQERTK